MYKVNQRKIQARDTKIKILNKSLELFRLRGVGNVTLREICKECGITTGALYHHFESKEQIIQDICYDGFNAFLQKHLRYQDSEFDAFELIISFVFLITDFSKFMGRDLPRESFKLFIDNPASKYYSLQGASYKTMYDIIERGQKCCQLRNDKPVEILQDYISSVGLGIWSLWSLSSLQIDDIRDFFRVLKPEFAIK
jgi:AcrR family transcriptional regulator